MDDQTPSNDVRTAGAADGGHGRDGAVADRLQRAGDQILVVVQRVVDRGAHAQEFLDVAAGGEGFLARAAQDHAAHAVGVRDLLHGRRQAAPHRGVHRVELGRIVQRYGGESVADLEVDSCSHAQAAFQ